jgi:hypothetical protein
MKRKDPLPPGSLSPLLIPHSPIAVPYFRSSRPTVATTRMRLVSGISV